MIDQSSEYPSLEKFSKYIGISRDNLVKAFLIEKEFHKEILEENSFSRRRSMYKEVYELVHPIYGLSQEGAQANFDKGAIIKMLSGELKGRSVLEVGCGSGSFLIALADLEKSSELVGLDISSFPIPKDIKNVKFINQDIIDFNLEHKFDIVYSDNVLEHISPMDLPIHLASIRNALKDRGKFIVIMPDRLFGPFDITRIVDFTNTNKLEAMGTHLNESTYGELVPVLRKSGFNKISSVIPLTLKCPWLPSPRVSANFWVGIEKRKWLMNLIYKLKIKFNIILICGSDNE